MTYHIVSQWSVSEYNEWTNNSKEKTENLIWEITNFGEKKKKKKKKEHTHTQKNGNLIAALCKNTYFLQDIFCIFL